MESNQQNRKELLNVYVFTSLSDIRQKAEEWMLDYNYERPHKALGYVPPKDYNPYPKKLKT